MKISVAGLICAAAFFVQPVVAAEYKTPSDFLVAFLSGNELRAYIAGYIEGQSKIGNWRKKQICPTPGTTLEKLEKVVVDLLVEETKLQTKYLHREVGRSMVFTALASKFPCKWD